MFKNPLNTEMYTTHSLHNGTYTLNEWSEMLSSFKHEIPYSKSRFDSLKSSQVDFKTSSQWYFVKSLEEVEATIIPNLLTDFNRILKKNNKDERITKYNLMEKYTEEAIQDLMHDHFHTNNAGRSGGRHGKEAQVIRALANSIHDTLINGFSASFYLAFCEAQRARSIIGRWFDYSKYKHGQSKMLLSDSIEKISQELDISFEETCLKHNISTSTLTKYRKMLIEHGAEFVSYKQFNKLSEIEKSNLKRKNMKAYATFIGKMYSEHNTIMKSQFKINWLRFVGRVKRLFGLMHKDLKDAIEGMLGCDDLKLKSGTTMTERLEKWFSFEFSKPDVRVGFNIDEDEAMMLKGMRLFDDFKETICAAFRVRPEFEIFD
jgi:hypothetical protein